MARERDATSLVDQSTLFLALNYVNYTRSRGRLFSASLPVPTSFSAALCPSLASKGSSRLQRRQASPSLASVSRGTTSNGEQSVGQK